MAWLEDLAEFLEAQGVGTHDPTSRTANIFTDDNDDPYVEDAIKLTRTGGPASDTVYPYDTPTFQVLCRSVEATASVDRHRVIYDLLHGKAMAQIGASYFIHIFCLDSDTQSIGPDSHGRQEYVRNYQAEVRVDTANRVSL